MPTLSRRGLFVLGGTGAAGVALAACGESSDPRETGDDDTLIAAEAEAEQRLAAAYGLAAGTLQGEEREALESFADAAAARSNDFGGGSAEAGSPDGGPDSPEALSAAINLANAAIAAHRAAVTGVDSADGRGLAISALTACAAELAAVSGFAGEPEVPRAFVTGGEADPYEAASNSSESDPDEESTSTTSTTSTTTEAE